MKGSNSTVIHGSLEWNDMVAELMHKQKLNELHRNFWVARDILVRYKDVYVKKFGQEAYDRELANLSKTKYELKEEAMLKRQEKERRKEERLRMMLELEQLKAKNEELKAKGYADIGEAAIMNAELKNKNRDEKQQKELKKQEEELRVKIKQNSTIQNLLSVKRISEKCLAEPDKEYMPVFNKSKEDWIKMHKDRLAETNQKLEEELKKLDSSLVDLELLGDSDV